MEKTMANGSKKSAPKVMDVSKPGKTNPDSSGRPLVVTHRPMVQDPTLAKSAQADETDIPSAPDVDKTTAKRIGIRIEPDGELKQEEEAEEEPKEQRAEVEENQQTEETPETEEPGDDTPAPKPAEPETSDTETSSDAATVDAVAGEAETKTQQQAQSKEETAKQEAVARLIETKQYNVSIKTPKSQTAKHVLVAVLLILLVAAVAFEIAIDAGIVDVGIPPVVDLIKN